MDDISSLLAMAARRRTHRLNVKLAAYQVTPAQLGVLVLLWEQDGLPLTGLAQRARVEGATMTAMVDRLERLGLVERQRDGPDRRVIFICLTAAGRRLEAALLPLNEEADREAVVGLSPADVARFTRTLRTVMANFDLPEL